jgi:succinoglycan biosynthesis protein ExoM
MAAPTEICVCIATHRRPAGLERLLQSLVAQERAPPFNVIVVDNDKERSGEPIAERFRGPLDLTYLVEPVRGIARTRNRAVAAARAPMLAFIDDDEWARPDWLLQMSAVARQSNADVVIGRVESVFAAEVPDYIRFCGLFETRNDANHAAVPWWGTLTGNALVRRAALPDRAAPFATRYDLTGAEDIQMFKRMIDHGARVVAAANALVFEHRPAARANLRWVVIRALRNGATIAEIEWAPGGFATQARRMLHSGRYAIARAASVAAHWRRDRVLATRRLLQACEEVGKMLHLLGGSIEEYRTHQ